MLTELPFWIIVIAPTVWFVCRIIREKIESRKPVYPIFKRTHFKPDRDYDKDSPCPICRKIAHGRNECTITRTICSSCYEKIHDRSILQYFKVPEGIAEKCSSDQIVSLNLIKIDLWRKRISRSDADQLIRKEVLRDMEGRKPRYRKIKASLAGERAGTYTFERAVGGSATCTVCGESRNYDDGCQCRNEYLAAYNQNKIPPKMRAISQEARELGVPEYGFNFNDYLYLKLIADDVGNGAIGRGEAVNAFNEYIDIACKDAEKKIALRRARRQAEIAEKERREAAAPVSQTFIDDMLS